MLTFVNAENYFKLFFIISVFLKNNTKCNIIRLFTSHRDTREMRCNLTPKAHLVNTYFSVMLMKTLHFTALNYTAVVDPKIQN